MIHDRRRHRLQGSACIVMQQISYYMAPRAHMPNTGTVVT